MDIIYKSTPFAMLFLQVLLMSLGLTKRNENLVLASSILGIFVVAIALSCAIYQG